MIFGLMLGVALFVGGTYFFVVGLATLLQG